MIKEGFCPTQALEAYNNAEPVGGRYTYRESDSGNLVEEGVSGVTKYSPLMYLSKVAQKLDGLMSRDIVPPEAAEDLLVHAVFVADRIREREDPPNYE